jgi:hypothetical protein
LPGFGPRIGTAQFCGTSLRGVYGGRRLGLCLCLAPVMTRTRLPVPSSKGPASTDPGWRKSRQAWRQVARFLSANPRNPQAGKLTGGNKLTADNGKVMRGADGAVTDGPDGQADEVIGGYFVIEADDYDGAVGIAKSCPHLAFGGSIEVQQIDAM